MIKKCKVIFFRKYFIYSKQIFKVIVIIKCFGIVKEVDFKNVDYSVKVLSIRDYYM